MSSNEERLAALKNAYSGTSSPYANSQRQPPPPPPPSTLIPPPTSLHPHSFPPSLIPHSGEACFIVACGPSLSNISAARLRAAVAGGVVFAVKQAAALLGDAADFHLMNVVNLQPLHYDDNAPIVVFHTCVLPFLINSTPPSPPSSSFLHLRLHASHIKRLSATLASTTNQCPLLGATSLPTSSCAPTLLLPA